MTAKLDQVLEHKNALLQLSQEMNQKTFKIGDKVRVLMYVPFREYQIFEGTVTRDKKYPGNGDYDYSVKVDGISRTEFDRAEMELITNL